MDLDIAVQLIESISHNLNELPPSVKFFFTSRPHPRFHNAHNLFPQEMLKEQNLNFFDRQAEISVHILTMDSRNLGPKGVGVTKAGQRRRKSMDWFKRAITSSFMRQLHSITLRNP
jgi:hypothetical protein